VVCGSFDSLNKSRQYSVATGKLDEPGRDEGAGGGSEEHDKEQRTALQDDDQVVYNRLFRMYPVEFPVSLLVISLQSSLNVNARLYRVATLIVIITSN